MPAPLQAGLEQQRTLAGSDGQPPEEVVPPEEVQAVLVRQTPAREFGP